MRRFFLNTLFFLLSVNSLFSQSKFDSFFKPSDTLNLQRKNAVVISEAALAGITLIGLNQLWYSDFERGKFRTVNDNSEWLQLDKLGHVYSAYQLGRFGANILNWSGVEKKGQLIYGATLGLGFLTAVEVFDGFSEEWGFSWGDMAANAAGTGLYIGQELLWNEQRIALKYSFHQTGFAKQNPDKLGDGFFEEFLKDKMAKRDEKEPGTGEEFKKSWFSDREEFYEPRFIETFNDRYKDGAVKVKKDSNAEYTMKVHTTMIYPGYNVGVVRHNSKLEVTLSIYKTSEPDNVIFSADYTKIEGQGNGGYDFNSGQRIADAYIIFARALTKHMYKNNK